MTAKKNAIAEFHQSYVSAIGGVNRNFNIYTPFLIFAALEFISLIFLFLSPRPPLRSFMGPFISTMWGEQYLHYPVNFLLLSKVSSYARIVLSILVGSFLTGLAIARFYNIPGKSVLRRYFQLFLTVLFISALYFVGNKFYSRALDSYFAHGHDRLFHIKAATWLGPINIFLWTMIAVVLQGLFTFAMPIIMTTERKFFTALFVSCVFFFRHFLVVFLLVLVPYILTLLQILLLSNTAVLMDKFVPEIVLLFGILGIIINSLIIDPAVTLTTAAFYKNKGGIK